MFIHKETEVKTQMDTLCLNVTNYISDQVLYEEGFQRIVQKANANDETQSNILSSKKLFYLMFRWSKQGSWRKTEH